jgi:hypothetical protein
MEKIENSEMDSLQDHTPPEEKVKALEADLTKCKELIERLTEENSLLKNPEIEKAPIVLDVEQLPSQQELGIHHKISGTNFQLPNGTQGKPYSFPFDLRRFGFTNVKYYDLTGLEKYGLSFNLDTCMIEGTPTGQGEFKIKLRYKFTDRQDKFPYIEKSISLIINPDPQSLWKNLPSDQADKYWKPDSVHQLLTIGDKSIFAASQRGRSHAQEGGFRDDHFQIWANEVSQWVLVCVADGAGSAKYSREGSKVACEEITKYFTEFTDEQYVELDELVRGHNEKEENGEVNLRNWLYKHFGEAAMGARRRIEQLAQNGDGVKTKDFSTTIVFSLLKKFDFGWFVGSFGIGDSPMGIYTVEQEPIIMKYPEEGEYSGQTYFLTMTDWYKDGSEILRRMSYDIVLDFTAIILMTDGIYDPKFETPTNFKKMEKWDALWKNLTDVIRFNLNDQNASEQLLGWLDFWSSGNHDDRTIVIIC